MNTNYLKLTNYIEYIKNRLAITTIFSWVSVLFKNPKLIRFFILWNKSLKSSRNALKDGSPWIVFEAKEWADSFLKKGMNIFEWGSGGSTIYIGARVKKLISVEHDHRWHSQVSSKLKEMGISNCVYSLKEPKITKDSWIEEQVLGSYYSTDNNYKNLNFKDYCTAINSFEDSFFDLVIVDGRARLSCIYHAIDKVKRGGYLLLDNSERKEYFMGINLLKDWERKDFYGPGPYNLEFWQTSIFKKI